MRLRSALIGLLVVASLAPTALAQATPEATLGRFIALANSGELKTPEGQAILTGEAKAMATEAKSNLSAADKVLSVSPTFAAARIVLRSGADSEMTSNLERDAVRVIAESPGVARGPGGPLASGELFVIINL